MRVTYVAHTRFPTESAHGHQIAQVCAAMVRLGHEVSLILPAILSLVPQTPPSYYGLKEHFDIQRLPTFDAIRSPFIPETLSFVLTMISYRQVLRRFLTDHATDLLYTRSPALLPVLLRRGAPVIVELHTLPRWRRRRFIAHCQECQRVVSLTSPMRGTLISAGVTPDRVVVEGDAVDLRRFAEVQEPREAKGAWGLPLDRPVILYLGSLVTHHGWEKGVGELLQALAFLKEWGRHTLGWIIGGPLAAQDRYAAQAQALGLTQEDVRFEGVIAASSVPLALAAGDLCVYPSPRSTHPYYLRDTSPLKLFEYLAVGRPIVCADVPPLRDVVDGTSVTLCTPGDPQALAEALTWVLEHPREAKQKAERGRELVRRHSWDERMKRILAMGSPCGGDPDPSRPLR